MTTRGFGIITHHLCIGVGGCGIRDWSECQDHPPIVDCFTLNHKKEKLIFGARCGLGFSSGVPGAGSDTALTRYAYGKKYDATQQKNIWHSCLFGGDSPLSISDEFFVCADGRQVVRNISNNESRKDMTIASIACDGISSYSANNSYMAVVFMRRGSVVSVHRLNMSESGDLVARVMPALFLSFGVLSSSLSENGNFAVLINDQNKPFILDFRRRSQDQLIPIQFQGDALDASWSSASRSFCILGRDPSEVRVYRNAAPYPLISHVDLEGRVANRAVIDRDAKRIIVRMNDGEIVLYTLSQTTWNRAQIVPPRLPQLQPEGGVALLQEHDIIASYHSEDRSVRLHRIPRG